MSGSFLMVAIAVAPYAKFADGLLSVTTPSGWLGEACRVQREGLTGHPEALSYPYDSCLWAGVIARQGEHGDGWWRYEQTAYYVDGLLRLGYALDDKELIAKGEHNVDYTLAHADPDGNFGDKALKDFCKEEYKPGGWPMGEGLKMWPYAVFFRAMKARYEAKPDPRIPALLAKFYKNYTAERISKSRNRVNIEGMLWTYGITGDKELLALARKSWDIGTEACNWDYHTLTPERCLGEEPLFLHGVSYCEQMKLPVLLYAHTGDRGYLDQAINVVKKLEKFDLLPDGCPASIEETHGNFIHWGHETCDIADFTWAVGHFLETTGDGHYADLIERCVFNAGFGAVGKDFRSLQYFSNLNQFVATAESDHNPYGEYHGGLARMQYRPTHETECCAGNVTRILPNYVSRMWLKDRGGDPVAALYGPCEVDVGWAKIREETDYPSNGKIAFSFAVRESGEHGFSFRVPEWCREGASARVNGRDVNLVLEAGRFATLKRCFSNGDVVELDFPMAVRFEEVPPCIYVILDRVGEYLRVIKGKRDSQATVVTRGPLLFAYAIAENRVEDTAEHPRMNGKKSANPAFKCWTLTPAEPFGYALDGSAADAKACEHGGSFLDLANPSVTIDVKARPVRWELDEKGRTSEVPDVPEPISKESVSLKLVPYGATQLRLSAFPVIKGEVAK